MDKQELGAFLRSRRERLRPEDVGIPSGPRRRTPGLRSAPGTSGKITALACRSAYAPANCPAAIPGANLNPQPLDANEILSVAQHG